MKYTDGFQEIESPFNWVKGIFEEVFNGEDTTRGTFYEGSYENLIKEQEGNYKDNYGVNYSLTKKQKNILKHRWTKLKEKWHKKVK